MKFKKGDLLIRKNFHYNRHDIVIFKHYTDIRMFRDSNNILRWVSHYKKSTTKRIESIIEYEMIQHSKYKFKSLRYPIQFTDKHVKIGCQTITMSDALDIAKLIQEKIGRK